MAEKEVYKKLSQLPETDEAYGEEHIPVVQNGKTFKIRLNTILDWLFRLIGVISSVDTFSELKSLPVRFRKGVYVLQDATGGFFVYRKEGIVDNEDVFAASDGGFWVRKIDGYSKEYIDSRLSASGSGAVKITGTDLPILGDDNKIVEVLSGVSGKTFTWTDGSITLAANYVGKLFWDGTAKTWEKIDEAELPKSIPNGVVRNSDVNGTSGGTIFSYLSSFFNQEGIYLDFTLVAGQFKETTGLPNDSTSWLGTLPIPAVATKTYTVKGLGTETVPDALGTNRIACFNGNTFLGFIGGGLGISQMTFTPLAGSTNFRVQVAASTGVAINIPNSPYQTNFKVIEGVDYVRTIKGSKVEGNINTDQIKDIQSTVNTVNSLMIFKKSNQDIVTTGGYLRKTGQTATSADHRRTSNSSATSMVSYDSKKEYYYNGVVSTSAQAGICYFDSLFVFIGYDAGEVRTYTDYKLSPPDGTAYIATSSYLSEPVVYVGVTSIMSDAKQNLFYVDGVNGIDTNAGTKSAPFKTLSKAVSQCVGNLNSKIIVKGGLYRESIDFSGVDFEGVDIVSENKIPVKIMGSNSITSWTLLSGYSRTYEAAFTGSLLAGSRMPATIFEHGRASKPILSSEINSHQKGLTHRLPFTAMVIKTSIADVEANPNSFYHDVANSKLYVHTLTSDNPSANGYSYEYIVRDAVINPNYTTLKKSKIKFSNIQFLYTKSVKFSSFGFVYRRGCTSIACLGSGSFQDDGITVYSVKEEAAYCDGDGINGHMSGVTNSVNLDQREGVQRGYYSGFWCHDNFDDGFSFHERSDLVAQGGLLEYNGDGGYRQSNDALIAVYDVVSRRNGWDTSGGTKGSGFDMVNTPSDNRQIGAMSLHNCISENNRNGIGIVTGGGVLNAYKCVSRNNTASEYFAESGVLNAYDCKALNATPAKIKVVTGTGVINVLTTPDLD